MINQFPYAKLHSDGSGNGQVSSTSENYLVCVCIVLVFTHHMELRDAVALTQKKFQKLTDAFMKRSDPGEAAASAFSWWEKNERPKLPLIGEYAELDEEDES